MYLVCFFYADPKEDLKKKKKLLSAIDTLYEYQVHSLNVKQPIKRPLSFYFYGTRVGQPWLSPTFSQIRTVRIYVPVSYGIPVVYSSSGHSSPTDGSISSIDPKSKVWSMSTPCSVPMISRSADHYIYDDTTIIGGTASIMIVRYDDTIEDRCDDTVSSVRDRSSSRHSAS